MHPRDPRQVPIAPDVRQAFPAPMPARRIMVGFCLRCRCDHQAHEITSHPDTDGLMGMYCRATGARVMRFPIPRAAPVQR